MGGLPVAWFLLFASEVSCPGLWRDWKDGFGRLCRADGAGTAPSLPLQPGVRSLPIAWSGTG